MTEKYSGTVDLKRLENIAGAGSEIQPRSTPTVAIATPELTIAVSGLTVTISNFVTKYRSCGKGFCK